MSQDLLPVCGIQYQIKLQQSQIKIECFNYLVVNSN